MRDTTFSSKAYGTHEYKDLTIEGRLQFDVYMALQRDHKLSSYTLNAVRRKAHASTSAQLPSGKDC
jgi:DNA polymerase delta subunit 1